MKEELIILSVVIFPLIFSVISIALFLGWSSFRLNPEKGLLQQGLLWLSIILPSLYFFVFGFIAWDGYVIDVSSTGLTTFFKNSTIPLTFLSLSIPLSVLVSRFHSTEQTAKQIAITTHKNNLDAFYSHRKELFTYFDRLQETNYLDSFIAVFKIHPRVHKIFFNGSPNHGIPEVNINAFKDIERSLSSARFQIDLVLKNETPRGAFDAYLLNACVTVHYLSRCLGLREIYIDLAAKSILLELKTKKEGRSSYLSVGTTTSDLIAAYRYANDYFENLCDFAGYRADAPTVII